MSQRSNIHFSKQEICFNKDLRTKCTFQINVNEYKTSHSHKVFRIKKKQVLIVKNLIKTSIA